MPFLPSAPSVYIEDFELRAMIADFSERIRRDVRVRPAMDRLVGNQWHEAEQGAEAFLSATLFLNEPLHVDSDFLERVVQLLGPTEIDALAEIMLDCALLAFPLQSAAAIVEVTEMLACAISSVVVDKSYARRDRLASIYSKLRAGALMNRF